MEKVDKLIEKIASRVNLNLREFTFDTGANIKNLVPSKKLLDFYAYYGIWSQHPIAYHFIDSNLAGSFFLGRCEVDQSLLFKCDVRGDELKEKEEIFRYDGMEIPLEKPERIRILNSFLVKTLVHSSSHHPESLSLYLIKNTVSAPFANIHGAPMEGCFLGTFSTVDLTRLHDCIIGTYAYVLSETLSHTRIPDGKILIHTKTFDFEYQHDQKVLKEYIRFEPGKGSIGKLFDLVKTHKIVSRETYDYVNYQPVQEIPDTSTVSRYAELNGKNKIGENVLVSERAFLENAYLGTGANAQENCYIGHSRLTGCNVTAHGGFILHAELKEKVFVGFNSFLWGKADYHLVVGEQCVIMPHTIIDLEEPVTIPPKHIVWGLIRTKKDLAENSISVEKLAEVDGEITVGGMSFKGSGKDFTQFFLSRIEGILKHNGAYYDGTEATKGHAQKGQRISFNIMQPYKEGSNKGIYPDITVNS